MKFENCKECKKGSYHFHWEGNTLVEVNGIVYIGDKRWPPYKEIKYDLSRSKI